MTDMDRAEAEAEEWADKLAARIEEEGQAKERYDREMALGRLEADHVLKSLDGKLPSQDRRNDWALSKLLNDDPELYHDYTTTKSARESAEVKERNRRATLSVRQTKARILAG